MKKEKKLLDFIDYVNHLDYHIMNFPSSGFVVHPNKIDDKNQYNFYFCFN